MGKGGQGDSGLLGNGSFEEQRVWVGASAVSLAWVFTCSLCVPLQAPVGGDVNLYLAGLTGGRSELVSVEGLT